MKNLKNGNQKKKSIWFFVKGTLKFEDKIKNFENKKIGRKIWWKEIGLREKLEWKNSKRKKFDRKRNQYFRIFLVEQGLQIRN